MYGSSKKYFILWFRSVIQWRPKVRSPPLRKTCFRSNFPSFQHFLLIFSLKMCLALFCFLPNFRISMARVWHTRSETARKGGERTFGHFPEQKIFFSDKSFFVVNFAGILRKDSRDTLLVACKTWP